MKSPGVVCLRALAARRMMARLNDPHFGHRVEGSVLKDVGSAARHVSPLEIAF